MQALLGRRAAQAKLALDAGAVVAYPLKEMEPRPFANRSEAGRLLAERLRKYAGRDDVVVLGLPRGGVPVAFEVSRALDAPLDVFVVRKLGVPGHEELAMGAIASGGASVLSERTIKAFHVEQLALERVVAAERAELERRER